MAGLDAAEETLNPVDKLSVTSICCESPRKTFRKHYFQKSTHSIGNSIPHEADNTEKLFKMKLDTKAMRYLDQRDWRVLTAVCMVLPKFPRSR